MILYNKVRFVNFSVLQKRGMKSENENVSKVYIDADDAMR